YRASIEAEKDNANAFRIGGSRKPPPTEPQFPDDHRQATFRELGLVPKAQVFDFDPDAPWYGQRGASIEKVSLLDAGGHQLQSLVGGEDITLQVDCLAHRRIERPIV